jgi:RNA polymerase sigma factor (sigma-70 family)
MRGGLQGSVLRSLETLFGAGSATGMSDRDLLGRFLVRRDEGAEAAFAALVARHGPLIWSVCRSISADTHAAEDAFQATFLILVRKAASIRRPETLGPWLYGVARRVAIRAKVTARRQRQKVERSAEMKASSQPDPTPPEELEALHEEIGRLPERYRQALVLCHLEGCTHADAAGVLKCPTGTVSVRVARAKELLRARLARRGLALSAALASAAVASETATAAMPVGLAETTIKAAMQVAAGKAAAGGAVSATVAQLTEGVLKTMTLTKTTFAAALVVAAASACSGIALLAMGPDSRPANAGPPNAGSGQELPPQTPHSERHRGEMDREQNVNNLKMIALAMHNFASNSREGRFPPVAIRNDGKSLLSWRVAILPYLEQQALYDKFHLDEPWDSPHNKVLLNQMPDIYAPVTRSDEPRGSTYYQVFTGPGALFEDERGPRLQDIKDGLSNTFLVVEAASAIPWTKPDDVSYDEKKPSSTLGREFDGGFYVAIADGSVQSVSSASDPAVRGRFITRNGGEAVTSDMLRAEARPGAAQGPQALPPPTERPRPQARRNERDQSVNNLKMIALAMHNFAANSKETRFAPAAIRNDGKSLLSWRVAILPFLEQQALYDRFHFDEPWNSPHNKTLLNQMPDIYAPVARTDEPRGSTYYQVFAGPGALFEDERGPRLQDVKDGTSNTFMVVEADSPVPWTKPEDVSYDKDKPLPKFGRQFVEGFNVAFADGSVRFVGNGNDPENLRRFITSSGGEIVTADMLRTEPQAVVAGGPKALPPATERTPPQARLNERDQSINNLKMIALAMHNFAQKSEESRFPPAAIRKNGKSLLSWRVAILPYLDQQALFDKFHLDEPWNSPHNKTLLNQMPEIYAPVVRTDEPRGSTYYQVFTGAGALFEGERGSRIADIPDGTSNTFMIVEAGSPVPWTKPEDVSYDKEKPLPKLGRQFSDGFFVACADGSVRVIPYGIDPDKLRRFITRSGGEVISIDWLRGDP